MPSAKVLPRAHPNHMGNITQHKPRSDNSYASKISHRLRFDEKAYLAGSLGGSILYGT